MDIGILTALASSTVAMAIPLLLAGLGELIAERAGVLNIGLEGMLLVGAFAAMACTYWTGAPSMGILCAALAGALLGLGLAFFVVVQNANQVVAGTALNLFALGITGVAYRAVFGMTGAALTIAGLPTYGIPILGSVPVLGEAFFDLTALGYASFILVPCVAFALHRTLPGLRLRMAGENPRAAATQGVAVRRVRVIALVICSVLAATGGAYLAVVYSRTFVEGMSAGRGFIALAIVILGRWSAPGIMGAALFFGLVTALQFHFQALGLPLPYQFFLILPYIATLLVLAGYAGRARAPAALGEPYDG
jgi:simple sugar transport system permease protein